MTTPDEVQAATDAILPCGHSRESLVKGNVRRTDEGDCGICLLLERIEELEAEYERWSLALQSLTPGGSEYADDPGACVAYQRDIRDRQHAQILKSVRRAMDAEARLSEYERVRWQPIETAPKDGSEMLLWDGEALDMGSWYTRDGYWQNNSAGDFNGPGWEPTHWMLPEPPAKSREES